MSSVFLPRCSLFFFFNDTATTEIYTLSLHDALPISAAADPGRRDRQGGADSDLERHARVPHVQPADAGRGRDRKSTRLNSSHGYISYAVFCLKKKNQLIPLRRHPTNPAFQSYYSTLI